MRFELPFGIRLMFLELIHGWVPVNCPLFVGFVDIYLIDVVLDCIIAPTAILQSFQAICLLLGP